jgi:hypothetical protein
MAQCLLIFSAWQRRKQKVKKTKRVSFFFGGFSFVICLCFFYFQGSSNFPGQYIESQGVLTLHSYRCVCRPVLLLNKSRRNFIKKHLVYSVRWESLTFTADWSTWKRFKRIKSQNRCDVARVSSLHGVFVFSLSLSLWSSSLGRVVQHPPRRVWLGIISGRSSCIQLIYLHAPPSSSFCRL